MAFRDETETLRARVAELEGELAEANATIERLTGGAAPRATGDVDDEKPSLLTGAPRFLQLERTLDFEVTDEGMAAIADLLRARAGLETQLVGRTLTGDGFRLECHDGLTHVARTHDQSALDVALLAAAGLGGGFGGLTIFAIVHDLFMRGLSEAHALWILPITILLALFAIRPALKRSAARRVRDTRGTFEAVIELARRHRAAPKARVELDEAEAAEELEAGETPSRGDKTRSA